jgi:hypothetical protein
MRYRRFEPRFNVVEPALVVEGNCEFCEANAKPLPRLIDRELFAHIKY